MNRGAARIAAVSGIVFAVLFVAALVLIHRAPALSAPDSAYTAFYAGGGDLVFVAVGLYLVPLSGIAFLWHMTAMRALLDSLTPALRSPHPAGSADDRPPAAMAHGLNLLAGVLFVAMVFAGTAAAGAVALAVYLDQAPVADPGVARTLTAVGYGLVFVFAVRAGGMFAITTTTLLRAGGVLSRPVTWIGYLLAAFLLLTATNNPGAALVFPAWVLLVSGSLLVHARRAQAAVPPPVPAT